MRAIYLDHAATTPLHPDVLETMIPLLTEHFGNPSSLHGYGRKAKQALTDARDVIASVLGCSSGQLFFTSGGTESDNTAIIGVAEAMRERGKSHIITTSVEHHAVLEACHFLEQQGYRVTYLPVDEHGCIALQALESSIEPDTALVSVMLANNEVGTLQPIEQIGEICRARGIYFHVDAVQALGAVPLNLSHLPVDLMSFSAHKVGGPKGVGLLYAARHIPLQPLHHGGSQERKKRPGTENVAGIVGFAKAFSLLSMTLANKQTRMELLRARFLTSLTKQVGEDGFIVNGHPEQHIASIVNISFLDIDKETMLMNLDLAGIAASGGSACTSGSLEDSHVLIAMGLTEAQIKSAIRFSFGSTTTEQEVVETAEIIGTIMKRLRKT
jgi:cysteine desulfurase